MTSNNESNSLTSYVGIALGISSQEWSQLGLGDDSSVAASNKLELNVQRLTSLLLIRVIAWVQPRGTFPDLSTTSVCRQVLVNHDLWPECINDEIVTLLKDYVQEILSQYKQVPYHNFEHSYHVTVSTNKLMDMILQPIPNETRAHTFGFRDDPLMQFAMIFGAIIHDVEHQGITNRQLANEDDELAIRYNDTSIAEHRSLYLGFAELLKPKYEKLRQCVFPEKEDYRRFRASVINLVLATDIASPERSQIGKSKWKEAFGDPYETVERKVRTMMERRTSLQSNNKVQPPSRNMPPRAGSRRMSTQSIMSELTLESRVTMTDGEVMEGGLLAAAADLDDDESVSISPDSSEAGDEEVVLPVAPMTSQSIQLPLNDAGPKGSSGVKLPTRRRTSDMGSTAVGPSSVRTRRRTTCGETDQSVSNDSNLSGIALKFHRRLSTMATAPVGRAPKRYRNTRLGLLRTVDLTGETIQTYQHGTPRQSATGAMTGGLMTIAQKLEPAEDVDELREAVVMETIIKAADVAHNLQGYDQMIKWSNRLFLELKKAYSEGRGDDPTQGWFNNQVGFLEAYLLPLARRLDDTGVFGDRQGGLFAENVERNRDRWTKEGMATTTQIIKEGVEKYPHADTDDDVDIDTVS